MVIMIVTNTQIISNNGLVEISQYNISQIMVNNGKYLESIDYHNLPIVEHI